MTRPVRFSLTDGERASYQAFAASRGMTLSAMAKAALFAYVGKERSRTTYNETRRTGRPAGRPSEYSGSPTRLEITPHAGFSGANSGRQT